MILLLTAILVSMFLFVNTMYYTISLLAAVSLILLFMVSSGSLSTLTMIIFLIVYVGAIIILIGYVCAISPNLITTTSFFDSLFLAPLVLLIWLLWENNSWVISYSTSDQLSNFFYTTWGLYLFAVLAVMLFIVLLIVTSQYVSPKGPFRSVLL